MEDVLWSLRYILLLESCWTFERQILLFSPFIERVRHTSTWYYAKFIMNAFLVIISPSLYLHSAKITAIVKFKQQINIWNKSNFCLKNRFYFLTQYSIYNNFYVIQNKKLKECSWIFFLPNLCFYSNFAISIMPIYYRIYYRRHPKLHFIFCDDPIICSKLGYSMFLSENIKYSSQIREETFKFNFCSVKKVFSLRSASFANALWGWIEICRIVRRNNKKKRSSFNYARW